MNDHFKKMIAPVVVTILVVAYYVLYFLLLTSLIDGILSVLLGVIPLLLGGLMIYVCIQRIQEIKGGEEDDLSKY